MIWSWSSTCLRIIILLEWQWVGRDKLQPEAGWAVYRLPEPSRWGSWVTESRSSFGKSRYRWTCWGPHSQIHSSFLFRQLYRGILKIHRTCYMFNANILVSLNICLLPAPPRPAAFTAFLTSQYLSGLGIPEPTHWPSPPTSWVIQYTTWFLWVSVFPYVKWW